MSRDDAPKIKPPNIREIPKAKSCFSCDHYVDEWGSCHKYDYFIGINADEYICDDWKLK